MPHPAVTFRCHLHQLAVLALQPAAAAAARAQIKLLLHYALLRGMLLVLQTSIHPHQPHQQQLVLVTYEAAAAAAALRSGSSSRVPHQAAH
jgi:hypothetical protein